MIFHNYHAVEFHSRRRFCGLSILLSYVCACICFPGIACSQWNPLNPVVSMQRESDGVRLTLQSGVMRLQVCSDSIIRVRYSPTPTVPTRPELVVIKDRWPATKWELQSSDDAIVLSTAQIKEIVLRKDSSVTFQDASGKVTHLILIAAEGDLRYDRKP